MAFISKELLGSWKDGDTFRAGDYTKERDVIVAAVNDNDARLSTMVSESTLLQYLNENTNGDHLGTWQGYSPSDFTSSETITPELIGAAKQEDLDQAVTRINNLYARRINLSDYPRLEGEENDTARFERAIADMRDGDTLIVPNDLYLAENINVNRSVSIVFEGDALIESVNPNPSHILKYEGTVGENSYVLESSVNRYERVLKLTTTPTDIAEGDMIVLKDDTVRVGDSQPDANVEVHEVQSISPVYPNKVISPAMNSDLDLDGVADNFSSFSSGTIEAIRTIEDNAQKISVTSSGSTGAWAAVYQEISAVAGQAYNFQVDIKNGTSIEGRFYISWYGDSGSLNKFSEFIYASPNMEWETYKMLNQIAPEGATKARLYFQAYCRNGGEVGDVWFRNADFREATTELLLKDFVRLPKSVSASQNVYKINPLENITVENFRYRLKEGSTTGVGLYGWNVRNFHVKGLQADRGAESAVQFRRSMYVTVEQFHIRNPQVVGSGQGYGVQFYGGNNGVLVKDGFTYKPRHSVDLDSTFDALVENVIDYGCTQGTFTITHNGWCSDITYKNCKSLRAKSSGFIAESQGVSDPYTLKHYNIQIIDCEWQRDKDPTDPVGYGFGVWLKCPVEGVVRNFKAQYGDGSGYTTGQDNGAIRILPTRNDLLIDGLIAKGFRRAIFISHTSNVAEDNMLNNITFVNTTIANCNVAVLVNYGNGKRIIFRNIVCDNILQNIFEGNSQGGYREFVLDGLTVTNLSGTLFQNTPQPDSGIKLRGVIQSIRSDKTHDILNPSAGWTLTWEDILLKGNGESVLLGGTATASGTNALPNGIVEGQKLTIMSSSGSNFTITSSNILYKGGASSITLSPTNRATTLEWRNGQTWYQII